MRYILWFTIALCPFLTDFSAAEPYTAVITADIADVYSGPGNEFYPVRQLRTGDKVEIYYEQGDWLAIRPPIGSFSWVSAKYVNIGTGNIGTVLTEGLASRIGSDYSDDCDTVQITLKKGENVLILDRRETPDNPASPLWLKIAPPNGEFRWLHRSILTPPPQIRQVEYDSMTLQIPELPKVAPNVVPKLTQPARTIPMPKIASAGRLTAQQITAQQTLVRDPFQRAFQELQQEAYIVMTRPTSDEVFALLIQRAEELHQIASTDQDLEKTYHLLESLQRTRSVRRELAIRRPATVSPAMALSASMVPLDSKVSVSSTNTGTPIPRQSLIPAYTPTSAQSSEKTLRAGVNIGGFDIVGRLGEFDPLPKGHPPFAVVDEKEQIICLISPSANLDLSAYVGQFVGINGILSYYEKPGKPRSRHLSAQNIQTIQ